jgi:hypothetical protein
MYLEKKVLNLSFKLRCFDLNSIKIDFVFLKSDFDNKKLQV